MFHLIFRGLYGNALHQLVWRFMELQLASLSALTLTEAQYLRLEIMQ